MAVKGEKYVGGPNVVRLQALIVEYGAPAVLAVLPSCPGDRGVPKVIEWLEEVLAAGVDVIEWEQAARAPSLPALAAVRADLEGEAQLLREVISARESLGEPTDVAREALATCETELAALTEQEANEA